MISNPPRKLSTIATLSLAEFLSMSLWFSASAVIPSLSSEWNLNGADKAWLTMSVQVGFVAGTLVSALLNLADFMPGHSLFAVSSLLAAASSALIPVLSAGVEVTLPLRFLTGFFLAGVYPVGMKIMATWTKDDRGLGIGLLVGALTFGSALPHAMNALGGFQHWQNVMFGSALLACLGAGLAAFLVREGPYRTTFPGFQWKYAWKIFQQRELALANFGYLGHMWELYAMWAWIPLFLISCFQNQGMSSRWASAAAFAVIAAGGVGSVLAGYYADKIGRTSVTIASMFVSGLCSLIVGFLYVGHPALVMMVSLVWGFAVVADSAQFSACISELSALEYIGTALTLQTSLGFLLTLLSIRLIPVLEAWVGWNWSFAFLSVGPAFGIWAMNSLRKLPAANRLAGGKK